MEDILLMRSGSALDDLVAEEIFKIKKKKGGNIPPTFSSNIQSAWRVLEFLIESCGGGVHIIHHEKPYDDCVWEITARDIPPLKGNCIEELICKAALLKASFSNRSR